jgi:hypothetical protein
MTTTPGTPGKQGRGSTWWTRHVELITAVIALIAAVASIGFGVNRNEAANTSDARVAELGQELGTAREQVRELTSRAQDAEAKVQQLESQLRSTSPTSGPDGTTSAGQPPIRHQGSVVIVESDGADLDAVSSDVTWGQEANKGNLLTNGGAFDVWLRSGNLVTDPINRLGLLTSGAADYGTCQSSGYRDDFRAAVDELSKDDVICVQTDEGRYSVLTLKDTGRDSATFAVTTYDAD